MHRCTNGRDFRVTEMYDLHRVDNIRLATTSVDFLVVNRRFNPYTDLVRIIQGWLVIVVNRSYQFGQEKHVRHGLL